MTIAPNPIFAREFRARWRDRRAWWLLLVLALGLSLLAHTIFSNSVSNSQDGAVWNGVRYVQMTTSSRAAWAGRQLFGALAIGNVIAWLLVAPILAATPIARERERGLLESLQLSHLSPLSQIAARTGAALAFLLFLQGAIAPIYGVVFWLGGVSPAELARAFLVIASTAWSGVALGTWISARSHRPSSALFSALGAVVVWTLVTAFALGGIGGTTDWWYWPAMSVFWTHPLPLILFLTDSSGQFSRFIAPPFGLDLEVWVLWCCAFWSVVSPILLAFATRLVARPLAPPSWEANPLIERWRASLRSRQSAAPNAPMRRRAGQRVEGALMADLPLERLARFSDPLLAREVRSRFRLRRGSWTVMLGRLGLFGAGMCVWMWAVYSLFDPPTRGEVAVVLLYVLWGLGALAIGALASSSFARERESGTWEGLKLSLLSPLHIARVKWLSPLITFFYYAAPLWILLPFSAHLGAAPRVRYGGLELVPLLLGAGVVACSLGTICMMALVISWRAKAPSAALGWTLGVGALLFIIVPIARAVSGFDYWFYLTFRAGTHPYDPSNYMLQDLLKFWHPIVALDTILSNYGSLSTAIRWRAFWVQLAICALSVSAGVWWLQRAMRRENKRTP